MASRTMSIADIIQLAEDFRANPRDQTLQLKVLDLSRHYPLAWSYILDGNYKECLLALPKYVTIRRINDGVMAYSKKEANALLATLKGNAKVVDNFHKNSVTAAPLAPINIDEYDDGDEKILEVADTTAAQEVQKQPSRHSKRQEKAIQASQDLGFDLEAMLEAD